MEVDEDDEDGEYDYIDINSLPNDQQQYFLSEEYEGGDGTNNTQETYDHQENVKFNESEAIRAYEENEDDEDIESDYCDDLAEIYMLNGVEDDVIRYKMIHLLDKGNQDGSNSADEVDKFQCPDTGAHFEYLDMCRRLKKL